MPRTFAPPDPGSDDLDELTEMYCTSFSSPSYDKKTKEK